MPRALAAIAAFSLLLLSLPAAAHDGGRKGGQHWGHGQHTAPAPGYGSHGPTIILPRTHNQPYFRHEFRYDQFRKKHFRGQHFGHGRPFGYGKHGWHGKRYGYGRGHGHRYGHGHHYGHRRGKHGHHFFVPGHTHRAPRHGGGFAIIIR